AIGISTYSPITKEKHNVLKRFSNVFDFAYRRYADVTKAEAQAREAKIEIALERTRTQSMLMQHSNELDNTLRVFHEQVLLLGIPSAFSFLWLPDEDKDRHIFWAAWAENVPMDPLAKKVSAVFKSKAINYPLDRNEPATALCLVDWKGKEPVVSYHVPPSGVENYFAAWQELIAGVEQLKPEYFSDGLYYAEAFMKYGCFGVMIKSELPEEEKKILGRFAIEFERAYTRFLDLQKAEAQSREAQIELGLERVRARAMAMQKSDELSELVDTVFKELTKLDFALTWCIINIIDESSMSNTVWAANPDIDKSPESYRMLFEDYPHHHAMMKGWKERKSKYVYTLEGNEKKVYDEYLFNETEFRKVPEAAQAASRAMEKYVVTFSFSNFGGLQTVGDAPLSDANLDILSRFGKVFDLTYTRFNDLKQAEAQAREAKIQLAMERVRARTMAMQRSEELADVATVLFQQVKALGVPQWTCGFSIFEIDDKEFTLYHGSADGDILPPVKIPLTEHPVFISFNESRKRGDELFVYEKEGEFQADHYRYMCSLPGVGELLQNMLDAGLTFPTFQIDHLANFSHGNLVFITYEPFPEMHDVFKRFAKVFEQTYTRFLDLQKAEAQAKEAKIEAALERVRSRSLAMHKSDEIQNVVDEVSTRLKELGVELETANIFIFKENSEGVEAWTASTPSSSFSTRFLLPVSSIPHFSKMIDAIKTGQELVASKYDFDEKNKFFNYLFEHTDYRNMPEERKQFILNSPCFTVSAAISKNIGIQLNSYSRDAFSDEENNILNRFTKVFEQAYTRFLDLQKAEAQTREAQIEVAVERVRAQSMAMHQTTDLDKVNRELYNQLQWLKVDGLSGVSIYFLDKEGEVKAWDLSSPGNIGDPNSYTIKFSSKKYPILGELWQHFKNSGDYFTLDAPLEKLKAVIAEFREVDIIIANTFEEAINSGKLTHQWNAFGRISNGVIGIDLMNPPSEDTKTIVLKMAGAFNLAYKRFLDLQKAEAQARDAQIEAALERVRSRSMGMQKSDELREVIQLVFEQLLHLNFKIDSASFDLNYNESDDFNLWTAIPERTYPVLFHIPYFDHPIFNRVKDAKTNGINFFADNFSFEAKNKFWLHFCDHSSTVTEERRKYILNCPGLARSQVFMNSISLFILNYQGIPYSEAENEI
ncbi:MAG TPA: hypothetical protein VI461_14105, partial [Chitinophagaceae bacterium]|nr:hypothetical protein [Chitinophagaceae bacterium]